MNAFMLEVWIYLLVIVLAGLGALLLIFRLARELEDDDV